MVMTRLRWALGAGLVLLSLAAAGRSLVAYLGHGLWIGSAAVLLLAVIAVAGFVSLLGARVRVERETVGLRASPPSNVGRAACTAVCVVASSAPICWLSIVMFWPLSYCITES